MKLVRESECWRLVSTGRDAVRAIWSRVSTGRDAVRVNAAVEAAPDRQDPFEAVRLTPGMDAVRRMGVAVTTCNEATVRESVRTRRGCNVLAGPPAAARRLVQPAGLAQRAAALARACDAGVRVGAAARVCAAGEVLGEAAG